MNRGVTTDLPEFHPKMFIALDAYVSQRLSVSFLNFILGSDGIIFENLG